METRTKQVLIAVDGSQPSYWAVSVGADLAARLDAAVVILHVIVPPNLGASEIALITDDLIDRMKAEGEAVLDAAREKLPPGFPARTVLREGFAAREIVAKARDVNADFIVIGSRGRGRWAHFILGSVAEAVVREAPCPVVTVAQDPGLRAAPFAAAAAAAAEVAQAPGQQSGATP